ncbi:hypothetical protein COL922a_014417 [Colletotrichum nupharicola]|nr:hypothetical protein COL922a_014417 [Colletotrichum nupharicola]
MHHCRRMVIGSPNNDIAETNIACRKGDTTADSNKERDLNTGKRSSHIVNENLCGPISGTERIGDDNIMVADLAEGVYDGVVGLAWEAPVFSVEHGDGGNEFDF